jgi:hypothetical protein
VNKEMGIIKVETVFYGDVERYYVNKSNLNKIKSIKENEYLNYKSQKERRLNQDTINYTADGYWRSNCDNGTAFINISKKEAFMQVAFNQIYINLTELKRYNFERGIAYKLEEKPTDLGKGGLGLNWNEYLNDKAIAYVKIIDDSHIFFYWYGFYNKKTKKREFKESDFNIEDPSKDIVLTKCDK